METFLESLKRNDIEKIISILRNDYAISDFDWYSEAMPIKEVAYNLIEDVASATREPDVIANAARKVGLLATQ